MLKYKVVYTSCTGNTGKLAAAIYQSLPEHEKDIEELTCDTGYEEAETYLVGFWTDKGDCPAQTREFLQKLSGKNVLLFGTCGFGQDKAYYQKIEDQVKSHLPSDCDYLGCYLCQGKMPMMVREKYEKLLADSSKKKMAEQMIRNFDQALLHPNEEDYKHAAEFVRKMCR